MLYKDFSEEINIPEHCTYAFFTENMHAVLFIFIYIYFKLPDIKNNITG